jgi:hypothetical protein
MDRTAPEINPAPRNGCAKLRTGNVLRGTLGTTSTTTAATAPVIERIPITEKGTITDNRFRPRVYR